MDPSKTPETDLSGFQEQGGYIDQETIDQLEEYDRKKKEEKKKQSKDPRTIARRKKKEYEKNKERLKNLPPDEDISAQGAAKSNPTLEDLQPKTPEEIEANRKGAKEARRIIEQGKKDRGEDYDPKFLEFKSKGTDALKIIQQLNTIRTLPYKAIGGTVRNLLLINQGLNQPI